MTLQTPRAEQRQVELHSLAADDAEFLYAVYASTRTQELAALPWSDAQREAFLRMQFEAQRRDYWSNCDTSRFRTVTCNGVRAGRLYVERRGDELHIVDIALLPEFRNLGIGSLLFGRLFDEADADSLRVSIHVEYNNPAQRLYRRLGFEFQGEADGVYRSMERSPHRRRNAA